MQAEAKNLKLANSSPCFEFWLLLHYTDFKNVMNPREAKKEFGKDGRIPGYSTPRLPYEELWSFAQERIPTIRSEKRRHDVECQGEDPRFARPVTYVDLLVASIVKLSNWHTNRFID